MEASGGGALDRNEAKRIRTRTYFGQELVARPRRLALMNLFLHGVEPHIVLGDTIYEPNRGDRFDVVLPIRRSAPRERTRLRTATTSPLKPATSS